MSVRWFSVDPRTSQEVDYSAADAKKLEDAHKAGKTTVNLTLQGNQFTVDLKAMTQSNNSGGSRQVKRQAPSASEPAVSAIPKEVSDAWNKFCGSDDHLDAEGFTKLFTPLKVDATNVDCFVFVYLLECKGCWKIARSEFEQALAAKKIPPTATGVGKAIEGLKKKMASDPAEWFAFCDTTFRFCRNSTNATIIPIEEAAPTLRVCFTAGPKMAFPQEKLLSFVESKVKGVTGDLWKQIAKFCVEVKPDLSNFDESQCWNTVIDDFVETSKL